MKNTIFFFLFLGILMPDIGYCQIINSQPIENPIFTAVPLANAWYAVDMGMGNISVVSSAYNTHTSVSRNPSLMFLNKGNFNFRQTTLNYSSGLLDLSGHYSIDDRHAIGIYSRYFETDYTTFVDSFGNITERNSVDSYSGIAYGYSFSKHFALGINLNFIHSDFSSISPLLIPVNALSGGVGFNYRNEFSSPAGTINWSVGGMASNIGSKVSYTENSVIQDYIPANLSLGTLFELKEVSENISLSVGLQFDKLLVPTPDSLDNNGNLIPDYRELTVTSSVLGSFSDAPGGFREEMQEINTSVGVEILFTGIEDLYFGVRLGGHYGHRNKSNVRYISGGFTISYKGIYANVGGGGLYSNDLDMNQFSTSFGYRLPISN